MNTTLLRQFLFLTFSLFFLSLNAQVFKKIQDPDGGGNYPWNYCEADSVYTFSIPISLVDLTFTKTNSPCEAIDEIPCRLYFGVTFELLNETKYTPIDECSFDTIFTFEGQTVYQGTIEFDVNIQELRDTYCEEGERWINFSSYFGFVLLRSGRYIQ